ncbi:hypothetical protein ElyMa_004387700 [Elysia marginata]|uniref:Uncharacterized protein n=1 Tax=Elysia marginata TaxID=1093978 RepID=A0AAV4H7V3_9GAST|nr:hypothetical protein ElyMa_004387700 [Elysia marginata]
MLTLYSEEKLTIPNTLFEQPRVHKATYVCPCSKHWYPVDLIITRRRNITDILQSIRPDALYRKSQSSGGIEIRYRTDGRVFELRRLRHNSKV